MAGCNCLCGKNMFSLPFKAEWKFLTLCSFCPPFTASSSLYILSFTVVLSWSDLPPSAALLQNAPPVPLSHPDRADTHPDGARGPVCQQALIFQVPSLLLCVDPGVPSQLPCLALQLGEPHLFPQLAPTHSVALLALPRFPATHFLPSMSHHCVSGGPRGHPKVTDHGFSDRTASAHSPLLPANNDELTCQQRR